MRQGGAKRRRCPFERLGVGIDQLLVERVQCGGAVEALGLVVVGPTLGDAACLLAGGLDGSDRGDAAGRSERSPQAWAGHRVWAPTEKGIGCQSGDSSRTGSVVSRRARTVCVHDPDVAVGVGAFAGERDQGSIGRPCGTFVVHRHVGWVEGQLRDRAGGRSRTTMSPSTPPMGPWRSNASFVPSGDQAGAESIGRCRRPAGRRCRRRWRPRGRRCPARRWRCKPGGCRRGDTVGSAGRRVVRGAVARCCRRRP